MIRKIAIVGSGAYGSYAASLIGDLHPDWEIHIYEVGDKEIKDQDTMGLYSELVSNPYDALTKGRYFGLGGATAKWGGQILTFSKKDFANPTKYLREIVELNEKYRQNIFRKVGIENNYEEKMLPNGLFTKTGIWLDYFSRNLFKKFRVEKYPNVTLHTHCRVTKVNTVGKKVISFDCIENGANKKADGYDFYILSAGAFETTRIMMVSGLQDHTCVGFSDHIAKKEFRIFDTTKIGNVDMQFRIKKVSFITTRIIGEKNGCSFFAYPSFNAEFPFFQNLKRLLFGKQFSLKMIASIIRDIPSCVAFAWSFFVKHKLYVYKNTWFLVLHMENDLGYGKVYLSDHLDKFNQNGLAIDFKIPEHSEKSFNEISSELEQMLKENNVRYSRVTEKIHTEKFEDEYHPFALYSDFESVEDYFNAFENMLVIHSGVLPRAGGINSTSAAFPLIEEFFRERYK